MHDEPVDRPATRSLMFVGAHPDDGAFTISGTFALLRHDPGLRVVLVLATDGEAGEIADDVTVPRHALRRHRRAEDLAAWRVLGRLPDRVVWLGLPDGALDRLPPGVLADRIGWLLAEERPDVVATFGPDGLTGHADHIAVGAATTERFLRLVADGGPGLRRLLHAGIPRSRFEAWNRDLADAELPIWNPELLYHFRSVPDAAVGIDVDCSAVALARVRSVRAHRSQWSYWTVPAAADAPLAAALSRESWVVAWPQASASAGGVFDGLAHPATPSGGAGLRRRVG